MKKVIFGMLAVIVLSATSCNSNSKSGNNEGSQVDTSGVESGPGLDSGERGTDTSRVDSSQVTMPSERKVSQ